MHQEMKGASYIKENTKMLNGMKTPFIMINKTTITN